MNRIYIQNDGFDNGILDYLQYIMQTYSLMEHASKEIFVGHVSKDSMTIKLTNKV